MKRPEGPRHRTPPHAGAHAEHVPGRVRAGNDRLGLGWPGHAPAPQRAVDAETIVADEPLGDPVGDDALEEPTHEAVPLEAVAARGRRAPAPRR